MNNIPADNDKDGESGDEFFNQIGNLANLGQDGAESQSHRLSAASSHAPIVTHGRLHGVAMSPPRGQGTGLRSGFTRMLTSITHNTPADVASRMPGNEPVMQSTWSDLSSFKYMSTMASNFGRSSAKVRDDPGDAWGSQASDNEEDPLDQVSDMNLNWRQNGSFMRGSVRGSQRRRLTVRQTEFMNRIMLGTTPQLEARKHILKEWTHAQLLYKLTITTWLSIGTIVFGYFTIPSNYGYVFVVAGILSALASFLGLRGSLRVADDIQFDDVGCGTVGQYQLQTYFHVATGSVLVLCPLAIHVFTHIDTITGSSDVNPDMLKAASVLSVLNSCVMVSSLRSVAHIVTFWQISHSFLESVATTLALLGVLGVVLISSFLNYSSFLSTTTFDSPLGNSILAFLGLCVVLVASSMVGFGAAWNEARPLLLCHSLFTVSLAIMMLATGVTLASIDAGQLIDGNCREIMQIMSYEWFDDVVGCSKYGGVAIGAKVETFGANNGFKYVGAGVGESASCPSKESHAIAWEYGLATSGRTSRSVMLEGCLQLACCNVLKQHITMHLSLLLEGFILLLITLLVVAYGDLWLRKYAHNRREKIKVMSSKRACTLLLIALVGTGIAFSAMVFLVWKPQPTQVSTATIRETLNRNITTPGLPAAIPSTSCFNDRQDGNETGVDCGGPCEAACTAYSGCSGDVDCVSGYCNVTSSSCRAETPFEKCSNGVRDGRETDVDCGGEMCATLHAETFQLDTLTDLERLYRCALGKSCAANSDCLSGMCNKGVCIGCSDGLKNGDEGDVDCGSRACVSQFATWYTNENVSNFYVSQVDPASNDESDPDFGQLLVKVSNYTTRDSRGLCLDGRACTRPDQCSSGVCVDGRCASCVNGLRDGDESDVDCGGRVCMARCHVGQFCSNPFDCASGACSSNCASGICPTTPGKCLRGPLGTPEENLTLEGVLASCSDGSKNGKETDTDCGGNHCGALDLACADGKECFENRDCASGLCDVGSLTCSSCFNSMTDGNETDVDCGGAACAQRCEPSQKCLMDSDCMSDLFCWTEDNIRVSTQTIDGLTLSAEVVAELNLPPANTCQVAAQVDARVRGYPLALDSDTIQYNSLFETSFNGAQELLGSPVAVSNARRLQTSSTPSWSCFLTQAPLGSWPFCCPLEISSTVSFGSVFELANSDDSNIVVLDDARTTVTFTRDLLTPWPNVIIRPVQCQALAAITVTTTISVAPSCGLLRLSDSQIVNLIVPHRTMIVGDIKRASCASDNLANPFSTINECDGAGIANAVVKVSGFHDGVCVVADEAETVSNPECASNCAAMGSTDYSTCMSQAPCCAWQPSTKYFRCFGTGVSDTSVTSKSNRDGRFTAAWPQLDRSNTEKPYHATVHVFADGFIPTTIEVTNPTNTKFNLREPVYMIAQPPQPCSCDVFMAGASNAMDMLCAIRDIQGVKRCHPVPATGGCVGKDSSWKLCDNTQTYAPTHIPSQAPTLVPSNLPTTATPSLSPSKVPTTSPTWEPTLSPSPNPSTSPTKPPTQSPTTTPTIPPTTTPTTTPTHSPSFIPTSIPSITPTQAPHVSPTTTPTSAPVFTPTTMPSITPTQPPSVTPSTTPTSAPSYTPTSVPSITPSQPPTFTPTGQPTVVPTNSPTFVPTVSPSISPSVAPTATDVCEGMWIKVFEQLDPCNVVVDLGETDVNTLFSDRFRYDIDGEAYAYYLRTSAMPGTFSIYKQMLNWTDVDNVLNVDFELYSTPGELDTRTNKWQYCNYNEANVGFPRDCGLAERTNYRWAGGYCLNFWSAAPSFAFYVCAASALPTVSPSREPEPVPRVTVTGNIFDVESEFGIAARVELFEGMLSQVSPGSTPVAHTLTTVTIGEASLTGLSAAYLEAHCAPDAGNSSIQVTNATFSFDGVPEGVYTLVVTDDIASTTLEDELIANGLSQAPFQTKMTTVHVTSDMRPVEVGVSSTLDPSRLRIVLEYTSVPDVDLVVTFRVSNSSEEECVVSGKTTIDNPCGCGGAVVTRDDTSLDTNGIGRDIITLSNIHQTIYRFTLTRVTPIKADAQEINWRTDGRCGTLFPLANGEASRCPADSIIWDDDTIGERPCCSETGHCGKTAKHCECRFCVDYRTFVDDHWQQDYRTDRRCLSSYYKAKDGHLAHCPTTPVAWTVFSLTEELRPCCSHDGECGATVEHCNCVGCLDYRKFTPNTTVTDSASLEAAIPTEISDAVVKVYNADGLLQEFHLPSSPYGSENYFDGHVYDGTATKSARYARLFCIDGKTNDSGSPPQLHAYAAPQYFQWEGQMLDMDADNCPGTNDCEYVDVVGFSVNTLLNGRYLKRYSRLSPFKAFPGHAISTRCRVILNDPDDPSQSLPSVLRDVSGIAYCLDICLISGSACQGVYWWEQGDQSKNFCVFYNNNERCGGMLTTEEHRSVYEKVPTLATGEAWYTQLDSMFGKQGLRANKEVHLYRVAGDSGTAFEWYFDHDLQPTNGFLGLGMDASPQNSAVPDGVTLWTTNIGGVDEPGARAAIEDSRRVRFTKFSQSCAHGANAPTLQGALQAASCVCGPEVPAPCTADQGCAVFPIRYANTDICLGRVQYHVVLQVCDPLSPFQMWTVSSEGVLYGVGVPVNQELGGNPDATRLFAVKIPSSPFDSGFLALEDADFGSLEPLQVTASEDGYLIESNGGWCLYQPLLVGWRARFVPQDSGVPCAQVGLY